MDYKDMPDKIYMVPEASLVVKTTRKDETQYTRTDLAQSLADALESIAKNTCCEGCQEAAKVAQAALANYRKGE